jgi:4-diphosphocytidyl-2-C-methyl-D-erythritol kinase
MIHDALRAFAPAKVNLSLRITGRRADGYHELQSLVVFADVGDWLYMDPTEDGNISLSISGPQAKMLAGDVQNNLVTRAVRLIQQEAGMKSGVSIHLDKRLPVGAGIGGGSSDAAAAMKLACRMWGVSITPERLYQLALTLGADVPVCLSHTPQWMEGIGEHVAPLPALSPHWLVLVNPLKPLETAAVFQLFRGPYSQPTTGFSIHQALHRPSMLRAIFGNDLTDAAARKMPEIGVMLRVISAQPACLYAGMSGSGSTCFGLFNTEGAANGAARQLSRLWPDYWVVSAPVMSGQEAQFAA